MRWGIATIMYEGAKPWYCRSLVETFSSGLSKRDQPDYIMVDFLYPAPARELAASQAVALGLDGVLWIDSDMEWKLTDVWRMLKCVEENPGAVIAFPYPARKLDQMIGIDCGIGFGFTWTPISCFHGPRPWFNETWTRRSGYQGEDVWFTKHLPSSIPILVMPDYSVGHAYEPGPRRKCLAPLLI